METGTPPLTPEEERERAREERERAWGIARILVNLLVQRAFPRPRLYDTGDGGVDVDWTDREHGMDMLVVVRAHTAYIPSIWEDELFMDEEYGVDMPEDVAALIVCRAIDAIPLRMSNRRAP